MYSTTDSTRIACLLFAWCVGGIATLIGLGGTVLTLWYIQQDRASESWPHVTGSIVTSRIDTETNHNSPSGEYRAISSDTDYSVELRYTYQVEGRTYEGHRLRFGSGSHEDYSDAMKEQQQFPEGKKVSIYYHPDKPGRSVLVRRTKGNWGQLIGLSTCLLVGLTLLFLALRSTMRKPGENNAP